MGSQITMFPPYTADQIAARLSVLFPRNWASDAAKYEPPPDVPLDPTAAPSPGVVYAVFRTWAQGLSDVLTQMQYALAAQRLNTEDSPELDIASVDFFGSGLPRPLGMSNADFAALITASLFQRAITRQDISNAIQALTGVEPRMIEPWNPGDTGAWDAVQTVGGSAPVSYWDVDTRANPSRWTDTSLIYQGFIETALPDSEVLNGNPLQTFDDSGYWDVPGYLFADLTIFGIGSVPALITKLKAEGTLVWFKYVTHPA